MCNMIDPQRLQTIGPGDGLCQGDPSFRERSAQEARESHTHRKKAQGHPRLHEEKARRGGN